MSEPLRMNIAVAGRMNAGKSTFTNALTQNATSIVDSTPGTTADAKVTLMEVHGLGPCKIFDTAGLDELGVLGAKKRQKTIKILHQSDIICLVKRPSQIAPNYYQALAEAYNSWLSRFEKQTFDSLQESVLYLAATDDQILKQARLKKKPLLIIVNDENCKKLEVGKHSLRCDLQNVDSHELAQQIKKMSKYTPLHEKQVLPSQFLQEMKQNDAVLLIIPLDQQSPKLRLLKPQSQAIEALLSKKQTVICFQLDLAKARQDARQQCNCNPCDGKCENQELKALQEVVTTNNVKLIITDSQAMDVASKLPGKLTTFSVMQMLLLLGKELFNYTNDSLQQMKQLKQKKELKILISEACQHDRITENCEDIGTRQIPQLINKYFDGQKIQLDYSFGKDDAKMDNEYDLVIHCGGCMISAQQMQSRVKGFQERQIPVVSYGGFLSFTRGGEKSFQRVTEIWK